MTANKQLLSLLKTKGTGAAMGKSLSTSDIETLETIFQTPKVNHTTLATLITALLMLPPTEDEKGLIDKLNKNAFSPLPNNLQNFFNQSQKQYFARSVTD